MNFDGSMKQDLSTSIGCILWDNKGEVLHVAARRGYNSLPLLTEALAMQFACLEVPRLGLNIFFLEGDNLNVINAVLSLGGSHWGTDLIVEDLRALLSGFLEVRIGHVF